MMLRIARFLRGYLRHPLSSIREEEITLDVDGVESPASYIRPRGTRPLPPWIVLHGITVPGRHHDVLKRFAFSLASTGAAIVIPDVPAWTRLQLDRAAGDRAIAAAARHLSERDDTRGDVNLIGFSFGGTQAITSSTVPDVQAHLGKVASFGGYCSLPRTLRFMMTGEHEWRGRRYQLDPDPYGRWIVAANYLPHVPELAHLEGVARASAGLAAEAGRQGLFAGDPIYDPLKDRLRAEMTAEEREIWDVLAPPRGAAPPTRDAHELADQLIAAALRLDPENDPSEHLPHVRGRIVLAHGHQDQLIPFSESLRLREVLEPRADVTVSITRLFAHSREADPLGPLHYPAEIARYFALLNSALKPG